MKKVNLRWRKNAAAIAGAFLLAAGPVQAQDSSERLQELVTMAWRKSAGPSHR